jgi:hypothetical protein
LGGFNSIIKEGGPTSRKNEPEFDWTLF